MKKYVSESIQNEYVNWKRNQTIFISAPTGTGKTTFILRDLVKYAASKERKILYLVNRTLLKEQIEEEINVNVMRKLRKNLALSNTALKNVITVKTYQEVEQLCKRRENLSWRKGEFRYIIADEAHYFLMDSLFNSNTEISLEWMMNQRQDTSLVFMSATIDRIRKYLIEKYSLKPFGENKGRARVVWEDDEGQTKVESQYRDYKSEASYTKIEIKLLHSVDDIPELVKGEKGKWLIFVDNINKGKELQKLLKEADVESKFIQAKTKHDEEVVDEVQCIVKNENFNRQVLIATSVLDNGISIKDFELCHLIIMTDTYEEFMQMLGRKRVLDEEGEGEEFFNVYIQQRSAVEFQRKQQVMKRRLQFIYAKNEEDEGSEILGTVLESTDYYENTKSLCYVWGEKIVLNRLAVAQCDYLYEYYDELVQKFDADGEGAFVKEQVGWLGYRGDEQEQYVKKLMETIKEKVCRILDSYVGQEMDKHQNQKMREELRGYFVKLLKSCPEYKTEGDEGIIKDLKKTSGINTKSSRTITADKFNIIMKRLQLDYQMKKPTKNTFIITKIAS